MHHFIYKYWLMEQGLELDYFNLRWYDPAPGQVRAGGCAHPRGGAESERRCGSARTEIQYTGHFREQGLGLDYYNARWYDPAPGMFTQADTLIPAAGRGVQAWDRYAYSYGNPVKYIDPSGHIGKVKDNKDSKDDDYHWNWSTWSKEQRLKKGEPLVFRIGEVVIVIMPAGRNPNIQRSESFQRLGMGLALAGEAFDLGELVELPITGGVGAPDFTAFGDVVITQLATWSNGQSPIGDKYDNMLPPLLGTNQDVLVQFGDFSIAFAAKAGGVLFAGPSGYIGGVIVDVATTGINLIYDHNRNFGSWENHIVIGTPVCRDCPDQWGLTYIVIWP